MLISEQFAKFIKTTTYDALPAEVVAIAKERILDTLGAAIAGYSNWDYSGQLAQACRSLGTGKFSVIGSPKKEFSAALVAMINAAYAHSIELDDGHKNAGCHAGAVVVPVALAMAQEFGGSGKDLICAVTVGYEVIYRIAAHVNPAQINKGFHPSSNCGVYGAAAAAGKLMGLTEQQIANGLGQAGMFAGGTMEATTSGQRAKCVQVGNAAYSGIVAAYLAQTGMEGCVTALEGKNGLFNTQSENVNVEDICRDLGNKYSIADTYNKLYPTCRHAQPGIEAVLDLVQQEHFCADEVKNIHIGTHKVAYDLTGIIKVPADSGEAKFSLAYGAAIALREHAFGVCHLTQPYYTDTDTLALAEKVTCSVDDEVQAVFPEQRGAKVIITLKDDRVFEKTIYELKGSPTNPVGWKELEDKFVANTTGVLTKENIQKLVKSIYGLETIDHAGSLCDLLE